MTGRRGFLSGLVSGTAVSIAAGKSVVSVATYAEATPQSGLTGLSDAQWQLSQEPSLTGDTALVNVSELPAPPSGYRAEGFLVRVNGGAPVTLPYGNRTDIARHIRISSVGTSSVETAIVWRDENDRETNVASDWSTARIVAAATTATPTVIINAMRTEGVAPVGFVFTATVRGFGTLLDYQELHYQWNYGDPGSQHKRMRQAFADVHGLDANKSFDHVGAHTYERPGLYPVTLTVTDRMGNSATSEPLWISVADPDEYFAGMDTICIDPLGENTGGPDGCRYVSTWAEAMSHTGNSSEKRWLLRRGFTYGNSGSTVPRGWHIGAYGEGSDPVLTDTIIFAWNSSNVGNYAVWGVEFDNGYRPEDPSLVPGPQPEAIRLSGPRFITLHDIKIQGFGVQINHPNSPVPKPWIMSSCHLTNWGDMGVFNPNAPEHAMVGCTIVQNPLTLRRDDNKQVNPDDGLWYADHGPYRTNYNKGAVGIIQCDLFSCNNWAGNSAVQLFLRIAASGGLNQDLAVSQCITEGGTFYIGPSAGNAGSDFAGMKISKNLHVLAVTNNNSGFGFGGVLCENNVLVCPPNPEVGPTKLATLGDTVVPENYNDKYNFERNRPNKSLCYDFPPIWRNNTYVDLRSSGDLTEPTRFNDFDSPGWVNNAVHAPSIAGFFSDLGLDVTEKFTPYYLGRRVFGENGNALREEFSNAGAGVVPVPLSGSSVIGAASGDTAVDDFTGALRRDVLNGLSRNTASQGAFEPDLES